LTKLPVVSGKLAIKAFSKAGWSIARVTGRHVIMMKPGSIITLSIPLHPEVKKGTLRDIIRDAGLTVEEFVRSL